MTVSNPTAHHGTSHRTLLWIVGIVLAIVLVVMLVAYNYNAPSREAKDKAQQLITAYQEAGLATPLSAETIARVLGDDGGAVCSTAGSRQQQGFLKTQLGVGGEFYFRPVRVDRRTLQGLYLIVQTYCPDKLGSIREFLGNLRFDNVVRG